VFHPLALALCLLAAAGDSSPAKPRTTVSYTVSFPDLKGHIAHVEAVIPTAGSPTVEIIMPVWSPGFYMVENYADQVRDLTTHGRDGHELPVAQTRPSRWRITTSGSNRITVVYNLNASGRSVTSNWVGEDYLVLNGPPTFVTPVDRDGPRDVQLALPSHWPQSACALTPHPDGQAHHYRAADYDELVDSPIIAGKLSLHPFAVEGSRHMLVDLGDLGDWDGARGAQELEKIVRETRHFFGFLPFDRYYFLNVFRGGGGLEHKDSTLLTASSHQATSPEAHFRWLSFVSHEYFHAFNVKRLRPIELGPFDYVTPPRTSSLWIAEGLTSYFGELLVVRAGLGTTEEYLNSLSAHITQLQNTPGRLVESLNQASLSIWDTGYSGIARDRNNHVSYYVKGPVVGFLLDAHIRRLTRGRRSLDDVIRLAYERYSGVRGFTPDQFRATAEEIAHADLKAWFHKALATTEELDYKEALHYFGLRFSETPPATEPAAAHDANPAAAKHQDAPSSPLRNWTLEIRPDATGDQQDRLLRWLGKTVVAHSQKSP